ncbi:HlyD family type I secretion periplasmic adaptor subunit, partial [Thioclava sp. BHET1]
QVIEHLEGGIVAKILVKDGDLVQAGQVLLQLDDEASRSELRIVTGQIHELQAEVARLEAERDGLSVIAFPPGLLELAKTDAEVPRVLGVQQNLFNARLNTLKETLQALAEQQTQVANEIEGQQAQLTAYDDQIALVKSDLQGSQSLLQKGLESSRNVSSFQREQARLIGLQGETRAAIASNRGQIAQLESERLKAQATRREQAVTDLSDATTKLAERRERQAALEQVLSRLNLRAPMAGRVLGLEVHAIGAVIRAAEPVMYIVPQNTDLVVNARVDPYHIDSVHEGQDAELRFS